MEKFMQDNAGFIIAIITLVGLFGTVVLTVAFK